MLSKVLMRAYLAFVATLFFVQLVLSADLATLLCLTGISCLGLIPFLKGELELTDVVYMAIIAWSGPGALFTKSVLGQPVDSNLSEPGSSALYLIVGTVSVTVGYLLSCLFHTERNVSNVLYEKFSGIPDAISNAVFRVVFALGLFLTVLHVVFRSYSEVAGGGDEGFGGFGAFFFLISLALSWQFRACLTGPGGRVQKAIFVVMTGVAIAMALVTNTKFLILSALLTFGFSVSLYDNVNINKKTAIKYIPAVIALVVAFLYITPLVHILRPQIRDLSVIDRIMMTWQVLTDNDFNLFLLQEEAAKIAQRYQSYDMGYLFPSTWNADRFSLVFPVDEVVRNLRWKTPMGLEPIMSDVSQTILPSFMVNKTGETSPDLIAWHYGFRTEGVIGRPVVGLVASSIASFGLAGALILPAVGIFASFVILKLVAREMRNNPIAIFFLVNTVHLAEKEFGQLLAFFARQFLIEVVAIYAIYSVCRVLYKLRYDEY